VGSLFFLAASIFISFKKCEAGYFCKIQCSRACLLLCGRKYNESSIWFLWGS